MITLAEKPLIEEYEMELHEPPCLPGAPVWAVKAKLSRDVSEVMPYLNAVKDRPFYGGEGKFIIWKDNERKYALRPLELAVGAVWEREQARELVEQVVEEINSVWERREKITPDHTTRTPPKVLDILKLLPRTNCGECGLASCIAFAAELIEGNRRLKDCPALEEEDYAEARRQLEEMGL
ncbi:MAG: (Fe-S)-binding protein [Actinomycetota bacterium]|nr:(Fe-S)-binding protein [Actinomycetota bacterium]